MIYIKKDKARLNGDCPIYIKIVLNKKLQPLALENILQKTDGKRLIDYGKYFEMKKKKKK